jgi:ferredoxin-NADP reductase
MPPYKISLKFRKALCADTAAFYFEKPEGFQFRPGQFANFTLLGSAEPDLKSNTRALSIASAPSEKDLMVAMRLRGTTFKRTLNSLPPGSEVLLQGPYGGLTFPREGLRPAVLIAGGIGITPFRSMIRDAADSLSPRRIFLFYSVRTPEEAAFLEELRKMEYNNGRYRFVGTVTCPEKSIKPWQGETGRISLQMISNWVPDLSIPLHYVAGPPGMVAGMNQLLAEAEVPPENIRVEEFAGYE